MNYEETGKLILQAKNICLIPSENEPESLSASLALFYTLRELGKNVNLVAEQFPEKLNFLIPSVDFISSPKNFVIAVPRSVADVSQIYYEKTDESLKIHLTIDKGNIKKENIAFYFQDAKPDLIVTLGIADFKAHLENQLDSFGFLLGAPIVNVDNSLKNSRFGQVNIVEERSISEIIFDLIKLLGNKMINKNAADCLLAGLTMYYENFKSAETSQTAFQTAAELIRLGANNHQINDNLYKSTEREIGFLGKILNNIKKEGAVSLALLNAADAENFSAAETPAIIEKIKTLGIRDDLLVLWESHASQPLTKGFFYSKKAGLVDRIASSLQGQNKNTWVFLVIAEENIEVAKERVLKLL